MDIRNEYHVRDDKRPRRIKPVERAITHMHSFLDADHSLDTLAEVANLSPFHFNRLFRRATGIPPVQFLYALRLEQAKRLVLTTGLPITDICFEVGYSSLGSFVRRFTEMVGCSPGRLRSLARELDPAALTRCSTESLEIPPSQV